MTPTLDETVRRVRTSLLAGLNDPDAGAVFCEVVRDRSRADDVQRLVWLLDRVALTEPTKGFKGVDTRMAKRVLATMLRGWLVHAGSTRDSTALADALFGHFDPNVRCYSTYKFHDAAGTTRPAPFIDGATGRPLLDKSHDLGVMLVDDEQVAIIWVGDED